MGTKGVQRNRSCLFLCVPSFPNNSPLDFVGGPFFGCRCFCCYVYSPYVQVIRPPAVAAAAWATAKMASPCVQYVPRPMFVRVFYLFFCSSRQTWYCYKGKDAGRDDLFGLGLLIISLQSVARPFSLIMKKLLGGLSRPREASLLWGPGAGERGATGGR